MEIRLSGALGCATASPALPERPAAIQQTTTSRFPLRRAVGTGPSVSLVLSPSTSPVAGAVPHPAKPLRPGGYRGNPSRSISQETRYRDPAAQARSAIAEDVRPLRERLLHVLPGRMVELAQAGLPGIDLDESAASAFNLAANPLHPHPRRAYLHAPSEILLKTPTA